MGTLIPFIFWVGFEEDPAIDPDDTYHNYQCLILAQTQAEAMQWGDQLAQNLLQAGEAVTIVRMWIESLLDGMLTEHGLQPIKWDTLPWDWSGYLYTRPADRTATDLYQGTAAYSNNTPADPELNVCIQAASLANARTIWQQYLDQYYPKYHITTCSEWSVPITEVGRPVIW